MRTISFILAFAFIPGWSLDGRFLRKNGLPGIGTFSYKRLAGYSLGSAADACCCQTERSAAALTKIFR